MLVKNLTILVFLQFMLSSSAESGKIVSCYMVYWGAFRPEKGKFNIDDMDPNICTHITYQFVGLNEMDDTIKSINTYADLPEGNDGFNKVISLKKKNRNLKVLVGLGGWNEGGEKYSLLAADPKRRRQFAKNAASFLTIYNFDGLDLIWMWPGVDNRGGDAEDKNNLLLLLKDLRNAFAKQKFLLTIALSAVNENIEKGYDVRGMSQYIDYANVLTMDYHGTWDRRTGINAPLYSRDGANVEATVEQFLRSGLPASKLILGIPFLGRNYNVKRALKSPRVGSPAELMTFNSQFVQEEGRTGYNEMCLLLKDKSSGWTRYWDEESKTPYAINNKQFISYEDRRSVKAKTKFAKEKGLGGVMVWTTENDDFRGECHPQKYELLTTVNEFLH